MAVGEERNEVGLTKAALFMLTLDSAVLARVLKHLNADEVTRVTQYYEAQLAAGHPSHEELSVACRDFLEQRSGKNPSGHFKEALALAFGTKAAEQMFRDDRWRTIAERIDPERLATVLQGERPQTLAVVLSQLPPRYSAEVLARLPEEVRADSVDRICRSERVATQALDALLRAIKENFAANRTAADTRDHGNGVQRAAAVLNQLDAEMATQIVDRIRAADPNRAAAVEQEMFHFNDLLRLDPKALQLVLAEVKPDRLAMALKGIPEELRAGIFSALPETVSKIVMEEIDAAGRVPVRDVQTARRELTNLALQLDREGKIYIRAGQEMVS